MVISLELSSTWPSSYLLNFEEPAVSKICHWWCSIRRLTMLDFVAYFLTFCGLWGKIERPLLGHWCCALSGRLVYCQDFAIFGKSKPRVDAIPLSRYLLLTTCVLLVWNPYVAVAAWPWRRLWRLTEIPCPRVCRFSSLEHRVLRPTPVPPAAVPGKCLAGQWNAERIYNVE